MIPRAAKDAGFAIARIMNVTRRSPLGDYDMFEAIWDEIESGNHTYGKSAWTRFIQKQHSSSDYWYKRVRTICFAELTRKESFKEAK